jgi:hypothetical protein
MSRCGTEDSLGVPVLLSGLPQGQLGKAIDYALKRWEATTRFLDDGVLEIDSNLIESERTKALTFSARRASRTHGRATLARSSFEA